MKQISDKISQKTPIFIVVVLALLVIVAIWRLVIASAQGEIYTPTPSQTVNPGQLVSVDVKINTNGEPVSYAQAAISYPSDKLTLNSIDYSQSAFPLEIKSTNTTGNIVLSRGPTLGSVPVSGDVLLAKLNFAVSANASGSASVDLNYANSMVLSNNTNTNILPSSSGSTTISQMTFATVPGPANATISLDPASQASAPDATFDVKVLLDTGGDSANTAQVGVFYPRDKFQYVGVKAGAAFNTETAPTTDTNGRIEISRYSSPGSTPANGSGLVVATLTFKTLAAATGSGSITVDTASIIARSTDNVNILKFISNASVGITVAPPPPPPPDPAKAVLSLDPATQSIQAGANANLAVKLNTNGDPVNVIQTTINYPSDLLEITSVTPTNVFPLDAGSSYGNGQITIARFVAGGQAPVQGDVSIATIIFKTRSDKKNTTAQFKFADGGIVARSTDNENTLKESIGATVNIAKSGTVTPGPITPGPRPRPRPRYNPVVRPSVVDDTVVIGSKDGGGTSGSHGSVSPVGYTVVLNLKDSRNRPIQNKRVDLVSDNALYSAISDANGRVVFRNVKRGSYEVRVRNYRGATPNRINIDADNTETEQTFAVTTAEATSLTSNALMLVVLVVAVLGGLGILGFVIMRTQLFNHGSSSASTVSSKPKKTETKPSDIASASASSSDRVFHPQKDSGTKPKK